MIKPAGIRGAERLGFIVFYRIFVGFLLRMLTTHFI